MEQKLENIKNIIFDFGGVLLNIDYNLTIQAFKRGGIENFGELYSKAKQSFLFDEFEKGLISPIVFRDKIRMLSSLNLADEQIDAAWNAMLLDLPVERINLLERLKEKYRIFLLSNTNAIHIDAFSLTIDKYIGIKRFNNVFDKIYYSSQIGRRKPHLETFYYVLEQNKLIPQQTLFIDDSLQHVEGALRVGVNAILLEPNKTILDIFNVQLEVIKT